MSVHNLTILIKINCSEGPVHTDTASEVHCFFDHLLRFLHMDEAPISAPPHGPASVRSIAKTLMSLASNGHILPFAYPVLFFSLHRRQLGSEICKQLTLLLRCALLQCPLSVSLAFHRACHLFSNV